MATLASNLVAQTHHHFGCGRQNLDNCTTDGSISMDSSDNFDSRDTPNLLEPNENSCSSDDTVLSVGNETTPIILQQQQEPIKSGKPAAETLSFKNIESHLNAISQITNSTLNNDMVRKSTTSSPRLSPCSTKSVPESFTANDVFRTNLLSPNCISEPESPQHDNNYIFHHHHQNTTTTTNNNNIKGSSNNQTTNNDGNSSLKFSIDNILKADFGRRITDPINIRKSKGKKVIIPPDCASSSGDDLDNVTINCGKTVPVDLSKNDTVAAAAVAATTTAATASTTNDLLKTDSSPSGSSGSTGSNSSNQQMLWPAWVYCTRYSDRPSSGRHFIN